MNAVPAYPHGRAAQLDAARVTTHRHTRPAPQQETQPVALQEASEASAKATARQATVADAEAVEAEAGLVGAVVVAR